MGLSSFATDRTYNSICPVLSPRYRKSRTTKSRKDAHTVQGALENLNPMVRMIIGEWGGGREYYSSLLIRNPVIFLLKIKSREATRTETAINPLENCG